MPDKFQPNDRVFAKIKGWPPWPAKVLNRVDGKTESYMILFYGTYDTSVVKPDSMFAYNDDNKAKYGKNKSSSRWKEAMEEIENNTPIGEAGPLEEEAAAPVEAMEVTNDTDDDGELMIDEGPGSQPPVLTKEVSKPSSNSSSQNGKTEPAKAVARRGSKASLSKRDSISSTSSAPDVSTPAAGSTTPGTEMVSRSGRKIKPKRFADDEISTPTPTKNKASSQDESSEGPPSKRAKRGGKTPPSVKSTPVTAEPKVEPPTRARMVIGKGKGAPPPKTPTSGKISPDILAPVPKVPTLKPAAAQRKPDSAGSPAVQVGKKPLPALIPAAGAAQAVAPQAAVPTAPPPVKRAPSLRQQARQEVEDEESENEGPPMLGIGVDEGETDDKENQKEGGAPSSNSSEIESESEMEKGSEIDETSSRYSEINDDTLTRIPFNDKDGDAFELRIEHKQDFDAEDDRAEYENTLQNIVKLKEDLEQGDQDTHETIQELMDANKEDYDPQDALERESRANQIRTLRIEGEVIEIIGEIVSCLGEKQAEWTRAYELLDRLGTHELTGLILKKHPEVVNTIAKLRNYVGNLEAWDMTTEEETDFKEGAELIRQKSSEIYNSFYNVFIPPEEQDATVPFEEIFKEEMKVFKEQTQDFTLDEVLGLTAENDTGGFEMFDIGEEVGGIEIEG